MNKIISFFILFFFLAISNSIPITVGCRDGRNNFNTIQDAVNSASDGDQIKICDGNFQGATVSKRLDFQGGPNVKINSGVISGDSTLGNLQTGFYLSVGASGTTFSQIWFICDGTFTTNQANVLAGGIYSENVTNVRVGDSTFVNCIRGIDNHGGNDWRIENNVFQGIYDGGATNLLGYGIQVSGLSGATANANSIRNNVFKLGIASISAIFFTNRVLTGNYYGQVSSNLISDNKIIFSASQGDQEKGIFLKDEVGDAIAFNTIRNNVIESSGVGITIWGSSNTNIDRNVINFPFFAGIVNIPSGNSGPGTIATENTIKNSNTYGILCVSKSFANVALRNQVTGSNTCDLQDDGNNNIWENNQGELCRGSKRI